MQKTWIFASLAVILFTFNLAFAQHHGGEAAPPISFGNKKVTVATWIEPADFISGKHTSANLKARFYDSVTNTNIEKVTYRVQIFSGNTLLASQMFYDKDGELGVVIKPNSNCAEKEIWRCTKYEGEKDLIVPSAFTSSGNSPPIIKGPVFDKPGSYKVKVAIIGATNPKTQTSEDIEFETTINIAEEQQFSFATAAGKTPITVKAFQDKITNFKFSESTGTISFVMPFSWEHAQHVSLVRNDIEIPKSFAPFQNVNSFKGTINGIPIFASDLHFDPHSSKNTNTLHFLVTGEELKILQKKNSGDKHTMLVEITPDTSAAIKSKDVSFSNGYKATISYDTRYGTSKDVAFTLAFFDSSGVVAKDIRYAFSVKDSKGNEFIVNTGNANPLGISVPSGVDSRLITIPSTGSYTLQLVLTGRGLINFDPFVPSSLQFDISETDKKTDTDKDKKSDKKDVKKKVKKDTKKKATKPKTHK